MGASQIRIPLRARDGTIVAWTVVDAADADFVNRWTWRLSSSGHATRGQWVDGTCQKVQLHRELLGLVRGDGVLGDHRDLDKLNNRRSNLRRATSLQNSQNRKNNEGSISTLRGVAYSKRKRKWQAQVWNGGRSIWLGYFRSERDAGSAARAARLQLMPFSVES